MPKNRPRIPLRPASPDSSSTLRPINTTCGTTGAAFTWARIRKWPRSGTGSGSRTWWRARHSTAARSISGTGRDQKKAPPAVRAEYDTIIARWLANGRRLPDPEVAPPVVTINEVTLAFVKYAEDHYATRRKGKPSAEVRGIKDGCRVLSNLYGRVPVGEFGPKALKATRAKMIEMEWSRNYTNKQINRLKRMFRWPVFAHTATFHRSWTYRATFGAVHPRHRAVASGGRRTGPSAGGRSAWARPRCPCAGRRSRRGRGRSTT